jgi:hypothetical protein
MLARIESGLAREIRATILSAARIRRNMGTSGWDWKGSSYPLAELKYMSPKRVKELDWYLGEGRAARRRGEFPGRMLIGFDFDFRLERFSQLAKQGFPGKGLGQQRDFGIGQSGMREAGITRHIHHPHLRPDGRQFGG